MYAPSGSASTPLAARIDSSSSGSWQRCAPEQISWPRMKISYLAVFRSEHAVRNAVVTPAAATRGFVGERSWPSRARHGIKSCTRSTRASWTSAPSSSSFSSASLHLFALSHGLEGRRGSKREEGEKRRGSKGRRGRKERKERRGDDGKEGESNSGLTSSRSARRRGRAWCRTAGSRTGSGRG